MAKSALLVKTSSLGDVIHALPAVSDVRSVAADVQVDWVVEEAYTAVPRLHAGVTSVIAVAVRRWRRALWRGAIRSEIVACMRNLRLRRYDAIVDAQGLFKSALLALVARGPRYGLDFHSSREPLAWCYDRTFRVSWKLHAVERNRALAGLALGYLLPSLTYGIRAAPARFSWLSAARYAVLLHATSAERKLWPGARWVEVRKHFAQRGVCCVLPWGNAVERDRCERLAAQMPGAVVPPALRLDEAAGLLAGAQAVIGVDTGLTHLAAALGVPTVGIYCATDPAATGIYGCARALNLGGISAPPAVDEVVSALERIGNGK